MAAWQVQDAKARFSELLDAAIKNGPQVVTRRGIETAVLVPIQEWRHLRRLGSAQPQGVAHRRRYSSNLIPNRRRFRRRPTLEFK